MTLVLSAGIWTSAAFGLRVWRRRSLDRGAVRCLREACGLCELHDNLSVYSGTLPSAQVAMTWRMLLQDQYIT